MTRRAEPVANPEITRWNEKYRSGSAGSAETVAPKSEPELVANLDLLGRKGLAFEAACGRGAHALYLATLGYDVIACDGAIRGLEVCKRSAALHGLNVFPFVCDLSKPNLPLDKFDLVSVVRYLEYAAFEALADSVKPGGLLFYKTLNTRYLTANPRFRRSFVVEPGELNSSFPELDVLVSDLDANSPGEGGSSFVIARKPFAGRTK